MNTLQNQIHTLVTEELGQAVKNHGMMQDENHAWGIIDEELWEAEQEYHLLELHKQALRRSLCGGSKHSVVQHDLDSVRNRAIRAACELIQVAAMCDKARMSLEAGQ